MRLPVLWIVPCLALAGPLAAADAEDPSWAIQAKLTESCCCNLICPCFFGNPPTRGFCQGLRLVEIEKGHHGEVSLDGVRIILAFEMGEWTKVYVDEEASKEQVAGAKALLQELEGFIFGELVEVKQAPLEVRRTKEAFEFASPAGSVKAEVWKGAGGKPVRLQNLAPWKGYTQYESTELEHEDESEDRTFEFAGTNAFTCHYKKRSGAERGTEE